MTTKAAVVHSLRSPFVFEEIELPDLQDTDVFVRIVAVGICHSDMASRDGAVPVVPLPGILGHEGAGVVERVGNKVRKVTPGDHVAQSARAPGCELARCRGDVQTGSAAVVPSPQTSSATVDLF